MGICFDALTEHEKNLMIDYIDTYALGGSGERVASLDQLLRVWDFNKEELFHMFGDKLILERDIEIQKDENILNREVEDAFSREIFIDNFDNTMIYSDKFRSLDLSSELFDLISIRTIAANIYNGNTFEIPCEKDKTKTLKIQHGCKAMKAIGKIAEEFGIEGFEDFRLKHSRVLNQKTLKGTLCLSIHPLDFMTMSDNDCGWSSCMSWKDEGCYRRGTVEMMNSSMVICAYLKSDTNMSLFGHGDGNDDWANKKWRELYVVTPGVITNVMGYPYQNYELTSTCLEWIRSINPDKQSYSGTIEKYVPYEDYVLHTTEHEVNINPVTCDMYNDFGRCDHYGYFNIYLEGRYEFNYSGEAVCMACGDKYAYYNDEGRLVCDNCDPIYSCYECGENYDRDDLYELDGELFCEYCYNDHRVFAVDDEEDHADFNCEEIHIVYQAPKDENMVLVSYRNFWVYDKRDFYERFNIPLYSAKHSEYDFRYINYIMMSDINDELKNILMDDCFYDFSEDDFDLEPDLKNDGNRYTCFIKNGQLYPQE